MQYESPFAPREGNSYPIGRRIPPTVVELPSLGTLSRTVSYTIPLYVHIQSTFVDAGLETRILKFIVSVKKFSYRRRGTIQRYALAASEVAHREALCVKLYFDIMKSAKSLKNKFLRWYVVLILIDDCKYSRPNNLAYTHTTQSISATLQQHRNNIPALSVPYSIALC